MLKNFGGKFDSLNERSSNINSLTVLSCSHQNIKTDFVTNLCILMIYINNISGFYLELFAPYFYNCYHIV